MVPSSPAARVLVWALLLALLLALSAGCQERIENGSDSGSERLPTIAHPAVERDLGQMQASGVLRVITRYNSSSYFIHKGGQAGFDYELIRTFAREQGLHVEVIVPAEGEELVTLLNSGRGDVICAGLVPRPRLTRWTTATRPTNFVQKVVVLRNNSPRGESLASLSGLTITIPAGDGFRNELLELKADRRLRFFVATGRPGVDPEELVAQVDRGEIEAVVVDDIIARAAMMHLGNLKTGPALGPRKPTSWFVRENCPELKAALNDFLQINFRAEADGRTRRSGTYGIIYDRYFENPLTIRRFRETASRPDKSGTISAFDELIRARAEDTDFDWSLIASQIFQESRFNPNALSPAGARGLMQVLPQFAGAQSDSLFDPAANLTAGLRLMQGTWQTYAYLDSLDRLRFTLAEYHAGHGHITDARRIAMEMGRDPNRWEGALAVTLPRLMQRKHFSKTRHGFYGGSETVEYVEQILNRYRMYMRLVERFPNGATGNEQRGLPDGSAADLSALPDLTIMPEPR
jgi:membrane-bound lytic murein transglycosylase F